MSLMSSKSQTTFQVECKRTNLQRTRIGRDKFEVNYKNLNKPIKIYESACERAKDSSKYCLPASMNTALLVYDNAKPYQKSLP